MSKAIQLFKPRVTTTYMAYGQFADHSSFESALEPEAEPDRPEVRVGRRWYLNPAVDVVEHRYTGRGGDRYRERIVNLGIGVLFQSGR